MGWFSSCEHEWSYSGTRTETSGGLLTWSLPNTIYISVHKCNKCGKEEDCTFSEHAYGSVYKCPLCGNHDDDDD